MYHLVQEKLGDYLFLVSSNREPYVHEISGSDVICNRPVSGLTEALDPVMRASKGTWVIELKKGEHKLQHHLEKHDAKDCVDGKQCVSLGLEIAQLRKNIESEQF